MLSHPMLNIRILFTNYDIIADFLNLAFCSEHCISIKHRILATVNINKNFNSDSLCAFKVLNDSNIMWYGNRVGVKCRCVKMQGLRPILCRSVRCLREMLKHNSSTRPNLAHTF